RVIAVATPTVVAGEAPPRPVVGPDGRPVRGVGTGAFDIPKNFPGGEYLIRVHELKPDEAQATGTSKVIAERRFVVNNYTPDRLEKKLEFDARTYGPGDVVQAKFELTDQSRPVAGARLRVAIQVTPLNGDPV